MYALHGVHISQAGVQSKRTLPLNLTLSDHSTKPTPISRRRCWEVAIGNASAHSSGWSNFSARTVFGDADARKLHASLTLFSEASDDEFLLETMFDVWFDGMLDEDTMTESARCSANIA